MDMIQFNTFADQLYFIHGIFTRRGGVSRFPFNSLNVGFSAGDKVGHVRENRRRIARCLGFEQTLYLHQVHGRDVAVLKNGESTAATRLPEPSSPLVADGAVTDIPGLLLVIQVADCQAVILYDPIKRVVANLHSGWRGSVQNISGRGVEVMVEQFDCDPADIRAGIGPSLGPCCAEFIHYKQELPRAFLRYRREDCHFDFWEITRDQLMDKGILPAHIETAGICTRCHPERFFSHRHERPTGRFAVAAGVAPDVLKKE